MRTIYIDHLSCSKPRKYGLFKPTTIQDYNSFAGIVREKTVEGKLPTYYLRKPKEVVNVVFI